MKKFSWWIGVDGSGISPEVGRVIEGGGLVHLLEPGAPDHALGHHSHHRLDQRPSDRLGYANHHPALRPSLSEVTVR